MSLHASKKSPEEILEEKILLLSFLSGVCFVIVELFYAIYSHSQSTLMDALYDASELVFIVLLLFLTPLFHMPVSEKHPYGFFQLESVFILIKNIMLISVTASVLTGVIEKLFSGGSNIDKGQVSLFQMFLGFASLLILLIMKLDEIEQIRHAQTQHQPAQPSSRRQRGAARRAGRAGHEFLQQQDKNRDGNAIQRRIGERPQPPARLQQAAQQCHAGQLERLCYQHQHKVAKPHPGHGVFE